MHRVETYRIGTTCSVSIGGPDHDDVTKYLIISSLAVGIPSALHGLDA